MESLALIRPSTTESISPDSAEQAGERARQSLNRCCLLFVLLAIALASADSFADADLWRHILTGRFILHSGHLPGPDRLSYTAFGLPERSHEWLAQILFATGFDWFGVPGLRLLKFICVGATMILLAAGMAQTRASPRLQRALLLASAVALAPQVPFRPQIFTFAFCAMVFAELARTYSRGRPSWALVPAFALWANLHGGFILGLAALATFAAATGARDVWLGRGIRHFLRLAALAACCAAATLVNPQGITLWATVLHSVLNPPLLAEWQPLLTSLATSWLKPDAVMFIVPLAIFIAVAIVTVAGWSVEDAPIVCASGVLVAAAFIAVRNIAPAIVASAIPLARGAHTLWGSSESRDSQPSRPLIATLAVLVLLVGGALSPRVPAAGTFPVGAIAFMKSRGLRGNVLCGSRWAEYLIWHFGPRFKVFINPRAELVYPPEVIHDYERFHSGGPGAERVLAKYPHDFVLVEPTGAGFAVVSRDPAWRLIYRDQVSILFARASSPIAHEGPYPVNGKSPTTVYFP